MSCGDRFFVMLFLYIGKAETCIYIFVLQLHGTWNLILPLQNHFCCSWARSLWNAYCSKRLESGTFAAPSPATKGWSLLPFLVYPEHSYFGAHTLVWVQCYGSTFPSVPRKSQDLCTKLRLLCIILAAPAANKAVSTSLLTMNSSCKFTVAAPIFFNHPCF